MNKQKQYIGLIQARMTSKRLPGKTLVPVQGIPLLERVVNNAKRLNFLDELYVLTSSEESDNPIEAFCTHNKINVFRGDRINVFNRFLCAIDRLKLNDEDIILRFTADNPILDFESTNEVFKLISDQDYVAIKKLSHIVPEFIKVEALKKLSTFDLDLNDFEHVTYSFRNKYKERFNVQLLPDDFNGIQKELDSLLTLDTYEDLERLDHFFSLYDNSDKTSKDIFNYIRVDGAVKLGNSLVGDKFKTFVIAEIGQNHNGSIDLAKELIDMAARAGVDAVKFQKRDILSELTKEAFDRPYESPNSFGKTYGEHRMFLELDEEQHAELKKYCDLKDIIYFCTPCDVPSVELLERIETPFYKVASRDLSNDLLLEKLSSIPKPIIISTGMADYEEIEHALKILKKSKDMLIIMQCTSEYPCSFDNVHLNTINTLKEKYGYQVGFSDHTPGVLASSLATIKGANIIEKHITLDRSMKGTDQPGSLEEAELKQLVQYIDLARRCLGSTEKKIVESTKASQKKLRRSITSIVDIEKGEKLIESMITLKSPGTGILYRNKSKILGKKALKFIPKNSTLKLEDFE